MGTTFHVVGLTHIDLSWRGDSVHYQLCQENMLARLLDLLDHDPDFTYVIEQIAQYRWLNAERPDLIARLRPFVEAGRVEIGGGMASTLDTNGPNGECYVRNHLIGRRWAAEHLGGEVLVGELIDTFGISAQTAQIHQQLGMPYLFANRLGGAVRESLFHCRALDGSTVLMAGHDSHSPCLRHPQTHFRFMCGSTAAFDGIVQEAADQADGRPQLVIAYDENEHVPSSRARHHLRTRNGGADTWRYSTLRGFFTELAASGQALPTIDGDFNPCFSGCYALRPWVRLRNRRIETALIEAEKWACLRGTPIDTVEAWWHLAAIHSHDIYSGSFPTAQVLPEVVGWLDASAAIAERGLTQALGPAAGAMSGDRCTLQVVNGLPWQRQDACRIPLPHGWAGASVRQADTELPCRIADGAVVCAVTVPACGSTVIELIRSTTPATTVESAPADAVIANGLIRITASASGGVERIEHLPSGRILAEACGGLLEAQRDDGTYQREEPCEVAVPAVQGEMRIARVERDACGERLVLAGCFPHLGWAGPDSSLTWEVELGLRPDQPQIDCQIRLHWIGRATAVRLHLPTCIDRVSGLWEIPFGCVRRRPHAAHSSARGGDWPAHRFVVLEDGEQGLGLVNTGCMGAEIRGGSLRSTLFRAPATVSHGVLLPDTSSCEHGDHSYDFAIVPFVGPWEDSPLLHAAQACNNPLLVRQGCTALPAQFSLEPQTCVLSAIKPAEDGSDELILRFYETAGRATVARLRMPGMQAVQRSDLREQPGAAITVDAEGCAVTARPFEIVTLRVQRAR